MPARYDNLGVSFQYPDNWELDESEILGAKRAVTVYSPQGAFFSVSVYPGRVSPADMGRAAVDAMRHEYPDVEVEEVQEEVAGRTLAGFDLNFFYLDLTNTAIIRSLRTDEGTVTIFYQAEDREFARLEEVFQAMTLSLLAGIDQGE